MAMDGTYVPLFHDPAVRDVYHSTLPPTGAVHDTTAHAGHALHTERCAGPVSLTRREGRGDVPLQSQQRAVHVAVHCTRRQHRVEGRSGADTYLRNDALWDDTGEWWMRAGYGARTTRVQWAAFVLHRWLRVPVCRDGAHVNTVQYKGERAMAHTWSTLRTCTW